MFGNADWFEAGSRPLGLRPKGLPGKIYLATWGIVLALPTLILAARGQWLETLVWLAFVTAVSLFDLKDLRKQRRQQASYDDLIYIGENGADQASTEKYDLNVKR